MLDAASVAQSFADIRRQLQKLEGFAGMNAIPLLEVANKVSVNRGLEIRNVVTNG